MDTEDTIDFIQNHVKRGRTIILARCEREGIRMPAPPIRCMDGFEVSVQASVSHYCTPRRNDPGRWGYLTFELGYPSRPEPLLAPYGESDLEGGGLTSMVYGQVPASVVVQVLDNHGGIDVAKTESIAQTE